MSKTVILDYPLMVGDQKVTGLSFRRPVVDDLETIETITNNVSKLKKMIELIGSATEYPDLPLTPRCVGKIDALDLSKIAEELADFLPRGRKVGESN